MSKRQLIILFSALIIIVALFSGLPATWNKTLYVVIALLIIMVAYTKSNQVSVKKPNSVPYVDIHGSVSTPTPVPPIAEEKLPTQA